MPSITTENYLKQILLEQQTAGTKERVPMGRIAASLGVVPGTATTMIKSLAASGWADYKSRKGVKLTSKGEKKALSILRRHRIIEVFLVKILGFDWSEIHESAEHLEHATSDSVLERIDKLCGHPQYDPHGDPIPSADGVYESVRQDNLLQCPLNQWIRITRILDQNSVFLRFAKRKGLKPDARIKVSGRDPLADAIVIEMRGRDSLILGSKVAEKILVKLKAT